MVGNGVTIKNEKSKQTSDIHICYMETKTIVTVGEDDGKITRTVINKTKKTSIR